MGKPNRSPKDTNTTITLNGGMGDDIYLVNISGIIISEKRNGGTDTVISSVDFTLPNWVENITLAGTADLNGTGNELDNVLKGNEGHNELYGLDGNDILTAGTGDDFISGGDGSDTLDGGEGYDTAVFDGSFSDYTISVEGVNILVTSLNGEVDWLSGIEALSFSDKVVLAPTDALDNKIPVAQNDAFAAISGVTLSGAQSLLTNDTDPDGDQLEVLDYNAVSDRGGTVAINSDGTFTYDSAVGFSGTDTFYYSVHDGKGGASSGVVTIEVSEEVSDGDSTVIPYYISGLIRGDDYRINPDDPIGTATIVNFAFAAETPKYYDESHFAWTDFEAFSEEMRTYARDALSDVSSHTNITFVETSVEEAGMVFGVANISGAATGLAYYPDAYTVGTPKGDIWINTSLSGKSFAPETEEYVTLIHEIGHSLGLQHSDLPLEEQSQKYSVMSDYGHPTFDSEASSFQLYDIAALQYLYGANQASTAGDDTFTADMLADKLTTIWDGGGHDILDFSSAKQGVKIDLREGEFSTASTVGTNNIVIAFGTIIEDVVGSRFNDSINGNKAANYIFGGKGNDVLSGGEGADIFEFYGVGGTDRITDFVSGIDNIAIKESEKSFADLSIYTQENGLLIEHNGGSIFLEGVNRIYEDDIIF